MEEKGYDVHKFFSSGLDLRRMVMSFSFMKIGVAATRHISSILEPDRMTVNGGNFEIISISTLVSMQTKASILQFEPALFCGVGHLVANSSFISERTPLELEYAVPCEKSERSGLS